MAELAFPISALALVLLVVTPLLSAVSRRVLAARRARSSWAGFGDGTTWAWLMLPTALPLAWLLSAALHQLEPGRTLAACRVEHVASACVDLLVLVGLITALGNLARRHGFAGAGPIRRATASPLTDRVERLVRANPTLRRWPVWLVEGPGVPAVFTFGAIRPVLAVRADFAAAAFDEDDAPRLRAALLHEAAHARSRDVLRQGLLRAALWLNPAARWLTADAERWRDAREAACDRDAVQLGADPLALAQSLVRAAGGGKVGLAALCGHDGATLRLRVQLLLRGASSPGTSARGLVVALAVAAVALVAPHVGGEGLLEHFHHAVEAWIARG